MDDALPPSRSERRRAARQVADEHDGVLPRWRLAALGYDHQAITREIRAERWQSLGTHTVALHTGDVSVAAHRWRAVWEVAAEVALVDGITALQAAGLTGYDDAVVHVSVPRNARCPAVDGVRIHRVRRTVRDKPRPGLPRTSAEVAALRAAAWARTDKQAALVLCLVVQQRVSTAARLLDALSTVRNRGRRPFVRRLLKDLADGAQSLGELDFADMCRRHGVPPPDRQVVRRTPNGRIYLDARWSGSGLVVEIDGAGHRMGLSVTQDNLRQNEVSLTGDVVLRCDLVGLRLEEEAFMAQVKRGLDVRQAA